MESALDLPRKGMRKNRGKNRSIPCLIVQFSLFFGILKLFCFW